MSLLLDALKRAEQAKQGAGEQPAPALEPLSFDTSAAPVEQADTPPQLITRDRLPDISQSLEILTDDIAPPPLIRKPKEVRKETQRNAGRDDSAQAQARRVFEAKEKSVNPKATFYIALGGLAFVALAAGGYFWYQMQPGTAPIQSSARVPAAAQLPLSAVAQNAAPAYAPVEIVPPLAPTPIPAAPIVRPRMDSDADAPRSEAPRFEHSRVSRDTRFTRTTASGLSLSEKAYAAFEKGDLDGARSQYEAALTQDPLNRDAILGLAALDARSGNLQSAEARYLKVLEINPRDPHAQAAMIALHGQSAGSAESRLKTLLAQQPDAGFLHFALGNFYAGQGRWSEAQQSYFKAYVAEPTSADFAFNLAISLDHLRQTKPAIDYYRKALSLSSERPGSFNPLQADSRLRELAPSP